MFKKSYKIETMRGLNTEATLKKLELKINNKYRTLLFIFFRIKELENKL